MKHRKRYQISLRELISMGILKVGDTFVHGSHIAIVEWGGLRVDGAVFEEPSPAARAVNGNTEVNGWRFWKSPHGATLADYRSRHPFA
jgi:hypothetical protein